MSDRPKRILVADDDPGIVDAIQLMLETVGYDVTTTVDGASVKKLKEDLPDLILLDIWMSGIDGRDICRFLKKQENTKDIPVIMISANRDTGQHAQECGANDFLSKPFEMDDLISKVEKSLKDR